MSDTLEPAKKVLEQPDLNPSAGPPQLPGQWSNPAAASLRSARSRGSALPVLDPRSEVKSSQQSKLPTSPQVPLSTRPSVPQPNIYLKSNHSQPAHTMTSLGYLESTASSNLKSKFPRKVISGDRQLTPHPKLVDETANESHFTKPVQQAQACKAEVSKDTPLTSTPELPAEPSIINDIPASLSASNDEHATITEAERAMDLMANCSLLSAAANNEHESEGDGSSIASHEDVHSQQGGWNDEDTTLFDISPADDFLHASIGKVGDPDFTQSTRTLVDEGGYVTNIDDGTIFQDDIVDVKPSKVGLEFDHLLKPGKGGLIEPEATVYQELRDKLKAAEAQIAILITENEQRQKQVNETEYQLQALREKEEIIAKAKLTSQALDVVIDQKEAENQGLRADVREMTIATQALQVKFKSKCDECDELVAGAHSEHPSELQLKFVVEELTRIREQHDKTLEAAEARFQLERDGHAESFNHQDEMIQVQDGLVAQLEIEVAETRDSLHDAEGRAELKEHFLRQMDEDFAALQNAITKLWRKEHDVGKPARREIARLEFRLQKARDDIKIVKVEGEQDLNDLENTIEQLEAENSVLREELRKSRYLNENLESDAAHGAEEMTTLRIRLSEAEETVLRYEILGPARDDVDIRTYRPPKRLSQQEILASSDPAILIPALEEAWDVIRCYEYLGLSNTETPIEVRELKVIHREDEVIERELDVAKKEEEVERAAGAAGVEVIILKDLLGEREMEVKKLERIVRGLEDDLVHQKKEGRVGEADEAPDADGDEEEVGVFKLGAKALWNDDGSYLGLDIGGLGVEHLFKKFKIVDGIVGDLKDEFKDKKVAGKEVDEEFHDAVEYWVEDVEE
ncbi:hypothetical protein E2P81_ATG04694 [Venturia nashicola]|nr:hypothetical protein E2P81_ATG04694 [Venturia nashicola]